MRRHAGIVMRYWLGLALILVCLAGFGPVVLFSNQAFATGGDDFNDNSKDLTKWGEDIIGHGKCAMSEVNSRLEYTCKSASVEWNEVIHPWILTELPYNANWEMQIDITNNTQLTKNGQWANLGIGIMSPYTEEDGIFAGLYASTYKGLPVSKGLWAELDAGGTAVASIMTDFPGLTNGAIRFAYTSGTKVITVYYDTDPSNGYQWIEYASYGVDGSGGISGNVNWGLTDSDKFRPFVYGYSELVSITSGQLYGDNFQETGGVVPPPPELSPYEGTIGTQITITGSGFGSKKGKVLLDSAALKIAKGDWSDTRIVGTVRKVPLPAGSYPAPFEIVVKTKHKPPKYLKPTDSFVIRNPGINSYSSANTNPGTEVTVDGTFFGGKKGKVYLVSQADPNKPKSCKVTYWYMDPADGTNSQIKFLVPKVDPGSYWLYVSNKAGNSPIDEPFQVD
jgi:hypothetical protein